LILNFNFSEEINEFWKNSLTRSKAQVLQNMMKKESYMIYDLCLFIFDNSHNVKKSLLKLAFRLFACSVQYFPLESVFDSNLMLKFLEDLNKISASRLDIMKCFGEICKINNNLFNFSWNSYNYSALR